MPAHAAVSLRHQETPPLPHPPASRFRQFFFRCKQFLLLELLNLLEPRRSSR